MKRSLAVPPVAAIVSVLAFLAAADVQAQAYPSRPITITVPFAAGGSVEPLARLIGPPLGARLGQPIVVEVKPGGSTTIGANYVAKSPPDGYSLLLTTSTHDVVASTMANLPYDPLADFAPVGIVGTMPMIVVVPSVFPVKSLDEFLRYVKASPGKYSFATGAAGGNTHLVTAIFLQNAGLNMTDIPYKGSSQALVDVVGGRVHLFLDVPGSVLPLIRDGKLRALAVTSSARASVLPDAPTLAESGFPGFDAGFWMGLLAPAKTPASVLERLNSDLNKVLEQPDMQQRLEQQGYMVKPTRYTEFGEFLKRDVAQFAAAVKALGLKAQ